MGLLIERSRPNRALNLFGQGCGTKEANLNDVYIFFPYHYAQLCFDAVVNNWEVRLFRCVHRQCSKAILYLANLRLAETFLNERLNGL